MSFKALGQFTPIEDIPLIHERLRSGFRSGKTKSIAFRKAQLLRLGHLIQDNIQRFKDAFAADLGRCGEEAECLELNGTLIEIKIAFDNVEKWTAPEKPPFSLFWWGMSPTIRKEPKGTVLIISPFNYPVYLLLCPLASAIAAGNTVMLKPSELTPTMTSLFAELVSKYLDPDVIRIVNGGVPETTRVLELPFDHIQYTGNGRVARIVMTAAARHLTPVTLELGGKNPCFIDPNCDVKVSAKRIMWGKLVNGGQLCLCPDYVLVPESFQDIFVEALTNAYKELHPTDPRTSGMVTRIVNERHMVRLKGLLDATKGTVVFGGEVDMAEKYIAPTLVKDVKGDDSLMSEELFGPILAVVPVKDLDEAIAFVNARENPLAIYVFTHNANVKKKVLDNTRSGTASVNEVIMHCQAYGMPFGGIGASGMGYATGKYAFDTFTHLRNTVDNPYWTDSTVLSARYTPYKPGPLSWFNWLLRPKFPALPREK
ncbi:NAD-dependent aldehyde dehydrogenase [Laetiporus sulphureus 93-53]|uniref:Aldehyde dehydrogenase n=1 Tax=Laetiporus sulphureus 93-53 TaxID=1314785 RepID=A0A165D4T0_9APHY|nr:NAD-dependent aldehyde dehydrogenase [Laetiporus sulphureus 93-53]KZT04151.1 NAD-dependent aldehyde dehydrogenase [Laetiporus sulphureus 93-53]